MPTIKSGQFAPVSMTAIPARTMPPFETKSLKLNVVAARKFTSLLFSLFNRRRHYRFTTAATIAMPIMSAPPGVDPLR